MPDVRRRAMETGLPPQTGDIGIARITDRKRWRRDAQHKEHHETKRQELLNHGYLMTLLETIALAGYGYTTLVAGFLWRQISKLQTNHLAHLEERVAALEQESIRNNHIQASDTTHPPHIPT